MRVLLWVEPVMPASETPGYYIQRGVAGVTRQPHPGAASIWQGTIQIGNAQFPPCRGHTLNVIVTVDEASAARDLLSGPQTDLDPAGLPPTLAYAEANNVTVIGVPSCHH